MMTREKLVYGLAMHLVGLLALDEYLDLDGNIETRGEVIGSAVKLTANELDRVLPTFMDRLKDIDENLAGKLAPARQVTQQLAQDESSPADDPEPAAVPLAYLAMAINIESVPQGYRIRCPRCNFAAQSAKKENVWRALVSHMKHEHRVLVQRPGEA